MSQTVRFIDNLTRYSGKILSADLSGLIAYWQLNDSLAAVTVEDRSVFNHDGTPDTVTFKVTGIGDGETAAEFDGAASNVDTFSASLSGLFNENAGTVTAWGKVSGAGVWADGQSRYLFRAGVDANNDVRLLKNAGGGLRCTYRAGGTSKYVDIVTSTVDWFNLTLTWDTVAGEVKIYFNGVQQGTTQTGLGVWAGALAEAFIGAYNAGAGYWDGAIAHVAVWDSVLSATEIAALASIVPTATDYSGYTSTEIAEVVHDIYGTGFVVPTDNYLEAASSGAGDASLTIDTGVAVVYGALYVSDGIETFTLDAQGGGLNRLDRIVLRRDVSAQTARLVVIKGTAAANPSLPDLTVEDLALWYVYVADGFGAASTISNYDIHDERVFGSLAEVHGTASLDNLLPNAEHMAWSNVTSVPEEWRKSAVVNSVVPAAIAGGRNPRGQAMDITLDPAEWVEIVNYPPYGEIDGGDYYVTVRGSLYLTSGAVDVSLEYDAGTVLTARTYKCTGAVTEVLIRARINTAAKKAMTSLNLRVENSGAGATVFTLNPFTVVKGVLPGPGRQKREILLTDDMYDAAWTATAKATNTYQIDLAADFAARVLPSTRAIIGRLKGNDSGSAAAAGPNGMESQHYYPSPTGSGGRLELASHTNSKNQEVQHITGVSLATHSVGVEVWAATVFTATYSITGIVI